MKQTIALIALFWSACAVPAADAPRWQLPGAETFDVALQTKLSTAIQKKGAEYRPRTRHLREDGSAEFVNRLILESSPYLLQHAHNPVNWYPWGDEAFETAARLGRPVLLSIGYSTCHWCHVMEEESFEDPEIAAYLNTHYISIKVDREERPDIDSIYMSAVQMLTGRGGWPMTTWLDAQRRPFFGGTYFPARDGDRGSRSGFLTLLRQLKGLYDEQPERVSAKATEIVGRIGNALSPAAGGPGGERPGLDVIDAAVRYYRRAFDSQWGGLKRAPKFPSSLPLRLLLRHAAASADEEVQKMAELTLHRMAQGGMYDQVGGGFHRYSVDATWLVPHFEKMLYDNALLTLAYLEGYQRTGSAEFARIAGQTLDYVAREMTSPAGGFYSATDADSLNPAGEREEGWFFTWTPAELAAALNAAESAAVSAYYGVSPAGNFEGRNILHRRREAAAVAAELKISVEQLEQRLEASRAKLYRVRQRRPTPLRDDKVLTSWNGLMISAMARGGFVLERPELIERAGAAAGFVLDKLKRDGRLLRSFNDGAARHNGYLDDYAFLIAGLLDLYETTFELDWLGQAISLQKLLDKHYRDERGGYFMTSDDHESLLAREKPTYDGAEPSGNSVALMNLLRLHELTTNDAYRIAADQLLDAFAAGVRRSPGSMSEMLLAIDFRERSPREVAIVIAGDPSEAEPLLAVLRTEFVPAKVVTRVRQGDELERHASHVPWLRGKVARGGRPTAYVCQQGVCQLPVTEPRALREQLSGNVRQVAPKVIDSSQESR